MEFILKYALAPLMICLCLAQIFLHIKYIMRYRALIKKVGDATALVDKEIKEHNAFMVNVRENGRFIAEQSRTEDEPKYRH